MYDMVVHDDILVELVHMSLLYIEMVVNRNLVRLLWYDVGGEYIHPVYFFVYVVAVVKYDHLCVHLLFGLKIGRCIFMFLLPYYSLCCFESSCL